MTIVQSFLLNQQKSIASHKSKTNKQLHNMADYHVLRIDSLLETLTLCNAGKGFLFQLDITSEISAQSGDYVLGYISSPVDEVRYIFQVESSSGNSLVLKKEFEVSNGVKCDFSDIEELQPAAFKKEFFTIPKDLFKALTSKMCRGVTRTAGPSASDKKNTIQTIYYGCPGTGKSYQVKCDTEGKYSTDIIWYQKPTDEDKSCKKFEGIPTDEEKKNLTNNIFRTTFHPDYDYATFVGCYKPVKERDAIDYKFIPQVFTNAYVCAYRHREDPIYLIIEEINRGNCAQIFGDLFQLLDRTNGESDYAIKPDTELAKYLASQGVPSEELKLPDNLHIYATMNTSDQSLFPMDSAFKRRWAMEYMPINYTQKKASTFTIEVAGKKYPWIKFLEMVNERIVNATDSEDKQMGEFFIKGDVDEREFKNKVMFYLWNDVCKDLYNPRHVQGAFFLRVKNKLETEKNDYFTFAELFSDRNENSRLLTEFFSYLESKYQEVKPEFTFGPIE